MFDCNLGACTGHFCAFLAAGGVYLSSTFFWHLWMALVWHAPSPSIVSTWQSPWMHLVVKQFGHQFKLVPVQMVRLAHLGSIPTGWRHYHTQGTVADCVCIACLEKFPTCGTVRQPTVAVVNSAYSKVQAIIQFIVMLPCSVFELNLKSTYKLYTFPENVLAGVISCDNPDILFSRVPQTALNHTILPPQLWVCLAGPQLARVDITTLDPLVQQLFLLA